MFHRDFQHIYPIGRSAARYRAKPCLTPVAACANFLFDTAEVKAGIVYRQGKSIQNRQGYRAQYYVRNNSAAGAIYETAGRLQPGQQGRSNNPRAGELFIGAMGGLYGKDKERGRLIFKAWEQDQGKATLAVTTAIDKAVKIFNATGGAGTQSGYKLAS